MTIDKIKETLVLMDLERNKINGIEIFVRPGEKSGKNLMFYSVIGEFTHSVEIAISDLNRWSEDNFKQMMRALATRMIYNSWDAEKKVK